MSSLEGSQGPQQSSRLVRTAQLLGVLAAFVTVLKFIYDVRDSQIRSEKESATRMAAMDVRISELTKSVDRLQNAEPVKNIVEIHNLFDKANLRTTALETRVAALDQQAADHEASSPESVG
jgi:hypothetical protein